MHGKKLTKDKKPLKDEKPSNDKKPSKLDLWLRGITPSAAFNKSSVPPAPDYALASSWAARPEAMGKAAFAPACMPAIKPSKALVDVFYVHPTTFVGTDNWNEDITLPFGSTRASEMVSELILPGQTSVFNGSCRIYAPRYRQATLISFFAANENGRAALDLAYSDVVAAFRHYLAHENNGRPFILAGHSQGTGHLMRLLAGGFAPALKSQLIAAYLLGFKITKAAAASFAQNVTPAKGAQDTGVFIAYDTYLDGTDAKNQPDGAEHKLGDTWVQRGGETVVGINPVNWSLNTPSSISEHQGFGVVGVIEPSLLSKLYLPGPDDSVGLKATELFAPVTPGVQAYLDADGFLKISLPEQDYMNAGIFGGNYHNRDMSIFYMNLRENIRDRIASHFS